MVEKKTLYLVGAVVTVGVVAGVGYYLYTQNTKPKKDDDPSDKENHPLPQEETKKSKEEVTKPTSEGTKAEPIYDDLTSYTKERLVELSSMQRSLGNTAYNNKEYDVAIDYYTEAIRLCPDDAEAALAYSNRAACYMKKNMPQKAVEDCDKALERKPSFYKPLGRRARAYEEMGMLEKALADELAAYYCGMQENQKVDGEGFTKLARMVIEKRISQHDGKFEQEFPSKTTMQERFKLFNEPLDTLTVKSEDADLKKAVKLLKDNKFSEAFGELTKYVEEKGKSNKEEAHNLLSSLYYAKHDVEKALYHVEMALQSLPNSVLYLVKRGALRSELMDEQGASDDFEKAIKLDQENPLPYFHRAFFYMKMNTAMALDDSRKAVERASESFVLPYVLLAKNYMAMDDVGAAMSVLKKGLHNFPTAKELLHFFIEVFISVKFEGVNQFRKEAEEILELLLSKYPDSPLSMTSKAYFLMFTGDLEGAKEYLLKAIELEPTLVAPYLDMANVAFSSNNPEESKLYASRALKASCNILEYAQALEVIVSLEAQFDVIHRFPHLQSVFQSLLSQK